MKRERSVALMVAKGVEEGGGGAAGEKGHEVLEGESDVPVLLDPARSRSVMAAGPLGSGGGRWSILLC